MSEHGIPTYLFENPGWLSHCNFLAIWHNLFHLICISDVRIVRTKLNQTNIWHFLAGR